MKKLTIKVTGRVQGVGFRYSTKMAADKLGIRGGVWNCEDGSVGVEAIGENEPMATFLEVLKQSPAPWGKVDELKITTNPKILEVNSFEIRN
ncbi:MULTISPECIES: acylphosphatase [unclassified Enterococcus]|uniref:acylphosphatase n=1 Tax=unclassified Enterococcus TaxID=2608891 RepID=UPI0015540E57|nr:MULTISPECIES: acylphosphatase [unclassified Enterococcus]MBS7576286.1 acylphosphatase [Enterococcus sp. MMGLQ5-2]MBS7583519.1 acylphosphatase [Enterococcus sp. MMGLQ5-1]NPD11381.1 acylphosphatase [Enterococcus sp. MMGLQ5-1]NPD36124.1 acylphosphatase [Enterococcus sp. MMGLQ5-2]